MKRHRELAQTLISKASQDEALLDAVIDSRAVADEIFGFHAQQAVYELVAERGGRPRDNNEIDILCGAKC